MLGSCVSMTLCVLGSMCPGPMCPVLFVSSVLCGHPLTKFKRFSCRCLKQSQQNRTMLNYYYVTAFYFYFLLLLSIFVTAQQQPQPQQQNNHNCSLVETK